MEGTGSLISFLPLLVIVAIGVAIYLKFKSGAGGSLTESKSAVLPILLASAFYLFLGFVIYGLGGFSFFIFSIYLIASIYFSYSLLKDDISGLEDGTNDFKKVSPFDKFGTSVYDFQYSFKSEDQAVITEVCNSITNNLEQQSGFSETKVAMITDRDKELERHDGREFILSRSEKTIRGGHVTLLVKSDNNGFMYSIKWWFLLSGTIDTASILSFVAFSPLSMPFWISSRLKGFHNLAAGIRKIYPAFYESHDLFTIVNSANKLTMETLISELDSRGIDTSDLKAQQAQAINISVSGGKTNFGSIVQGASNSINTTGGGSN